MIKTDFAQFNVAGSATDQVFLTFFFFFFVESGYAWKGIRRPIKNDETCGNKKKTMWQVCQKAKKISASLLCVIQTRHVVRSLDSYACDLYENIVLK